MSTPILTAPVDLASKLPVLRHLDQSQGAAPLSPAQLSALMSQMMSARALDEHLSSLHREGQLGFYSGAQRDEASLVASAMVLRPEDWVAPGFRALSIALAKGASLESLCAAALGNGIQPPGHFADRALHIMSPSASAGTQITQAVGVAWAMKLKKAPHICAAYFGVGSTSESAFHNGLNFAGVYQLPCVFFCNTPQSAIAQQTAAPTVAQKAIAYGIEAQRVDAQDAIAVHLAASTAAERARGGEGPTLIELCVPEDPADPIALLRAYLVERDLWSDAEEQAHAGGIERALAAPLPKPQASSLSAHVFSTPAAS